MLFLQLLIVVLKESVEESFSWKFWQISLTFFKKKKIQNYNFFIWLFAPKMGKIGYELCQWKNIICI